MVSEKYISLLRDYITTECANHARRPGGKGVNAYSRYTERVLSEWGLSGFAAGQISRWRRGEVKADLDSSTLQRLGLLRGMSREPEEAGKLAWAWLNGDNVAGLVPPITPTQTLLAYFPSNDCGTVDILDQIVAGQFTPRQLREIAIAAVEQLTAAAEQQEGNTKTEPAKSALSWLLQGWMIEEGATMENLAEEIGTSVERTQRIIQGYSMTDTECAAVAKLTRLKIETLVEWGHCPSLRAKIGNI